MQPISKSTEAELLDGIRGVGDGIKQLASAVRDAPGKVSEQTGAIQKAHEVGRYQGRTEGKVEGSIEGGAVGLILGILATWVFIGRAKA